jgi:predicted TIM-barrel fold metal-dependent hydrolase
MAREYRLISSDSHLEVKPERWTKRVPERYRDRAPRTVTLPDGGNAFMIEGQPLTEVIPLDNRAGRPEGEWKPFGLDYEAAAGSGSPEQRVREMEMDGLDAEILFPAQFGPHFWRNISHDVVYDAVVRAYNDWLAEEYCSFAPDRLIGLGVIPMTNADAAVAELEHCARLGLRGVVMYDLPNRKSHPTPEDDKFWAAVVETGMPLTVHVALGPAFSATGPLFKYPNEDPQVMKRMRRGLVEAVANFGQRASVSLSQLVLAGVFERFPGLNIFFAETRLGWVPFWLESADLWYERHMPWARDYLGFEPIKRLPSEYIKEHISWSVQYERVAVKLRHEVGVDKIMFATDFPHIECEWPNSRSFIDKIYADVPESEKNKIWAGNAIEFFKLNAAKEEQETPRMASTA